LAGKLVVATKLLVPGVRPETVQRSRLTRALADSTAPLTVVSAPAGYGKTTALVGWVGSTDERCAWVSLDASDNDPGRLFAHLLAAVDRALGGVMEDVRRALLAGADLSDSVVPLTVNALAEHASDGLVLVLDDYHLVEQPTCHKLLAGLIDAAVPGVRIVVAGRTQPPLRLARRRAAGTLAEIGVEQLRFDGTETKEFLNGSLALDLERDQIRAIDERIDGWAAGLSLVASSLRGRPDADGFLQGLTASRAKVAEYLIEEVLDATVPRVRDFLCRTSILGRLSAPLCEAVLDDRSARKLLAEVRRSNLFVNTLDGNDDGTGEWLVYHDLVAELLERELHERSPELVPTLHLRASGWFAANGAPDEAIRHATAAGDGERAAELLLENWRSLVAERRYVTLRQTIAQLPPERGALADFCEALDTLCMALEGADLRVVAERLDELDRVRDSPGVAQITDQMRVSPYFGDVSRAVNDGWELWKHYSDERAMRMWMAGQFGIVLWFAGDHDDLRAVIEPIVGEIERPTTRSWALSALALSAADDGDVDLAERHAHLAVELAEASRGESALEFHLAYVALAETMRLRGALDEAKEQLAHAAELTNKLPGSVYQALTLVFQAQLDLVSRDRRRARSRAAAARKIIERYPDVGTLAERLAGVEGALERRADDALLGSRPTPAELRLLELLPSDLTLKQIASEHLYVSIHTVTSHARRLYRRLGVRTRAEAVAAARERGLI
jgi:LuxR family maltose regulon positive regulatory protein